MIDGVEENQAPDQTQPPFPPRYWWLKRVAMAVVFLLLAVGVLRWRVDVIATHRLNARIASIQAAGEPILPADFNTEPVPEEENAVTLLAEAVEKFVELNPEGPDWRARLTEELNARLANKPLPPRPVTIDDILDDPALLDANFEVVERLLHDNEDALQLLHEARFRLATDWGVRFDDSVIDVKFPSLYKHGELAKLACVAALVAHHEGDDLAAIAHLQDVLAFADSVGTLPHLVGSLMAIVMSTTAAGTLEDILPTLKFDETEAGVGAVPTGLHIELENMMEFFLADEAFREGVVLGFQFERACCLDGVRMVTESGMASPDLDERGWPRRTLEFIVAFLYRPLFRLDGVRLLDGMTAQASECRAQLLDGEAESGPDLSQFRFDRVLDRQTAYLSALLLPSFYGTTEKAVRDLSRHRLAATAIAIRLYELEHGIRPSTLDDLVPEYLTRVPLDPFSATGEQICYVPVGPNPGLELGSSALAAAGDGGSSRSLTKERVVFKLWPFPPAAPASSQPNSADGVNERDGVQHQPGHDGRNEAANDQP